MGLVSKDDRWRIPDALWAKMEPLLPPRPRHPLGCHNPRVPDRSAMEAILFVLRTGCPWNALNATGICKSSSAHRRFVEWVDEGVFHDSGVKGFSIRPAARDRLEVAGDGRRDDQGAAGRGKKAGPNPTDRAKDGTKRSLLTDAAGIPLGLAVDGATRNDHKLFAETVDSIPVRRPAPTTADPQGLCLDKGYDYDEVRELAAAFGFTLHAARRGQDAKAIKKKAGYRARRGSWNAVTAG